MELYLWHCAAQKPFFSVSISSVNVTKSLMKNIVSGAVLNYNLQPLLTPKPNLYNRVLSVLAFISSKQVWTFLWTVSVLRFAAHQKWKSASFIGENFKIFKILKCKLCSKIICSACKYESNIGFTRSCSSIFRGSRTKSIRLNSLLFQEKSITILKKVCNISFFHNSL